MAVSGVGANGLRGDVQDVMAPHVLGLSHLPEPAMSGAKGVLRFRQRHVDEIRCDAQDCAGRHGWGGAGWVVPVEVVPERTRPRRRCRDTPTPVQLRRRHGRPEGRAVEGRARHIAAHVVGART